MRKILFAILMMTMLLAAPAVFAVDEISPAEEDGIMLMREEEKLARDVYTVLHEQWGLNVFRNIASSEDQHTTAMQRIISRYDLTDPVTDDSIGIFTDSSLSELYDELVDKGMQSITDALEVGIMVEELDIKDLEGLLQSSLPEDIKQTYERLLRGSERHLVSFEKQLARYI